MGKRATAIYFPPPPKPCSPVFCLFNQHTLHQHARAPPHHTKRPKTPLTMRPRLGTAPRHTAPGAPLEVRGQGEHVSAPLRRGAAPYADGCERVLSHSHPHSLTLSAVLGLSSRLTWHDFAYATMAQKVHSSTLMYPLYPYSTVWSVRNRALEVARLDFLAYRRVFEGFPAEI